MASTVAHETMLVSPLNELDSECSSGGDERQDIRKRNRDDADVSSPKKRRKQTTPVRFPASLMTEDERGESDEDNEEDDEARDRVETNDNVARLEDDMKEKGKTLLRDSGESTRDENLNTEFRCQFCDRLYDDKNILALHLEQEHGANNQSINFSPISHAQVRVKLEQQEEPENPVNLSGLGIKNFATSWLSSHGQVQLQSQESEWSNQHAVTSLTKHLPSIPFPGALAQYLPLPAFSIGDSNPLARVPVGPAPIRIFNPDAYCDLCNKEFCNKYFLKTHKANKHGIYVDTPITLSGTSDYNGSNFSNIPFPSGNIIVEQQTQQQSNLEIPTPTPGPQTPTVPCDICQKRFKNDDLLHKHKQKIHVELSDQADSQSLPATVLGDDEREVSRSSPSTMESLFKHDYGIEQEDTKFMPAPRHLSPQSSQQAREFGFNHDGLRRLGVINPDAFCEICCKEYCNKYFLRTHKLKRHGIIIQDGEKSPNNSGTGTTWHQIQTSPLNLIVTENTPSSESNDNYEEFECKPCSLKFQTIELYEAHRAKMHESEDLKSPIQDIDEERTDSISEDLQKLQTMILQLNGLDSSKISICGICGRECENKLALKTHMSLEHGTNITEEVTSPSQLVEYPLNTAQSTFCTLCEKYYRSQDALRQHIAEEHQQTAPALNNPPKIFQVATPPAAPPPAPPIPPPTDKKIASITPTSSYCEICNKELCNKYFMKTHMQRMHGIEIENGSQIGGVICNICNKELCSKYFLRVHKHNTHGIIDEGTAPASKPESGFDSSNPDDTALKSEQLGDLSHRYFTHFTEVCPMCTRRFRSIKWLKAHLFGDHAEAGVEKWRELEQQYQNTPKSRSSSSSSRTSQQNPNLKIPNGFEAPQHPPKTNEYPGLGNQVLTTLFGGTEDQQAKNYRCSYCNFTTTVLPFLFLHERSHTNNPENLNVENTLQCPICSQTFPQPELLHHHLLSRHQFSGMLSQFQSSVINPPLEGNQERVEIFEQKESESKDERHQISSPIQANLDNNKNKRDEPAAVQVTPQGAYKCAQCSFATANLNRIKKHVKKDHKTLGDPTDCVIDELSKTLRDVANKHKVPASYAMPQDMNSNPDATVMQPFIIEEQDCGVSGDEYGPERRFAPALVYLPVRTRVTSVLSASFTLSPA
ncbi:hypothetical protein PV325_000998 [Microctonus aethiopoides]|uniref:C2H2-type domain-containing protein n=1 Tax=Microctonus aethiopoides TaxID=144406 RepID=A0AA39KQY4_9HYME|nr:hypothetical protein PV325_000998 [Microctonus aethiopoides]KAK0098638.1 hypothetical protein PV326_005560 [Microctonus aethiopoides]KAK0170457.1 hypothetical protein PV328_011019 [Microctonus aethiopoides]